MRVRHVLIAAFVAGALSAPARAGAGGESAGALEPLPAPGALFEGLVREEDVALLFDHLRASLLAASQGREAPPPPPALTRRGDEMAGELRARGTAMSLLLLDALERAARRAAREARPPQPAPR